MVRFLARPALRLACGCLVACGGTVALGQERLIELTSAVVHVSDNEAVAEPSEGVGEVETVQERYPNRLVRIERQVIQDGAGNYVNHGTWSQWDERGRLMARGEYRFGQRHGQWVRAFNAGELAIASGAWGKSFQAPFLSAASFSEGKLHGTWQIIDAGDRQLLNWEFQNNERHGKSTWYFANGHKWREADYRNGELDGEFLEWTSNDKLLAHETFVGGQRLGTQVEWHSPGVKKVEAQFLFARDLVQSNDDWWNGTSQVRAVGKDGKDQRHGPWVSYFRNGQKAIEGRYEHDRPEGKFVWWHPNGQKAIEGEYVDGLQVGAWQWWHPNGQKQIQGAFADGIQAGKWTRWNSDGKVTETVIYSDQGVREEAVAETKPPKRLEVESAPVAEAVKRVPREAVAQKAPHRQVEVESMGPSATKHAVASNNSSARRSARPAPPEAVDDDTLKPVPDAVSTPAASEPQLISSPEATPIAPEQAPTLRMPRQAVRMTQPRRL